MRALLALALGVNGCSGAIPPPREHPTFVSLNPCADAILAEVADPAQIIAISSYSHDPRASSMPQAQAQRFRAVRGSAEEVLALAPDVVLASPFLAPGTRQAVAHAGIAIVTVGVPTTVAQSQAQVRALARVAGHDERGEQLVARIDMALAHARPVGRPISALVWQQGGIVPGPRTLIADLLSRTGFSSHSAARGLGQGAYLPLEQVLADPTQVVMAAGGERILTHPALRRVKGMHYASLDPTLLFCGGPTIERAARRLAEIRRGLG